MCCGDLLPTIGAADLQGIECTAEVREKQIFRKNVGSFIHFEDSFPFAGSFWNQMGPIPLFCPLDFSSDICVIGYDSTGLQIYFVLVGINKKGILLCICNI
ncbi:hypothetical protein CEXT_106791 [Caerostris extrusa]|uniref:Uncharacterized protein n=1 Tax=Caerostris extrusa TaxID=172846 RepID=A0AAV4SSR2_CAEEX|nr:hypothetical protein CEXT_106791 [Caerostris extrusa]